MTASSPDPACNAPTATAAAKSLDAASIKSTCASSDSAPSASPQTTHRLGPTVSSDESAAEAVNAPHRDDPAVQQDNVPQIVHPNSTSTNTDGIVGAPGASHNMVAESSNDTFVADALEQSSQVAAKDDCFDVFITSREPGEVRELLYTPRDTGEVHTTATNATAPPRTMSLGLATHDEVGVGMSMTKRIEDAANVAKAPIGVEEEGDVDQEASTKKRKPEDQLLTKKDQPTKKKTKVLKDPNAPEKNKTAYMHYATYARAWIKDMNPNAKASEVTKTVRKGWNDLSFQSRDHWDEQAIEDKLRYDKELAAYKNFEQGKAWQAYVAAEERKQVTSNSTIDVIEDKKPAEDSTDPAFMNYDTYARKYITSRHPQKKDIEVTMILQSGWNVLSAKVRNYWERVALADRLEYTKRIALYQRFELTVQEVVEAKVSTQEALDYLCSDETEVAL